MNKSPEDIEFSRQFAINTLALLAAHPPELSQDTDTREIDYRTKEITTYVFEYEAHYSAIDPVKIQLKIKEYSKANKHNPIEALRELSQTSSLHASDIQKRYKNPAIISNLEQTKSLLDNHSLALQLPLDKKYHVITTGPLNYIVARRRTMFPKFKGFFMLTNSEGSRYFSNSYDETPLQEYDKKSFYAMLEAHPQLQNLKENFRAQEEKIILTGQLAPSSVKKVADTFRI